MAQLYCLTESEISGLGYGEVYRDFCDELGDRDDYRVNHNRVFAEQAVKSLRRIAEQHPFVILRVFLQNVFENTNTSSEVLFHAFPRRLAGIRKLWEMARLNYGVSLLTLIGTAMLLYRRKYRLLFILAGIYVYFAVSSGFTHDQSARIIYPCQIAWAVIASYPLLWLYDLVARKLKRAR
jgi:hypothetical protein